MSDGTKIEWTDYTWNPLRGCSRVSDGCRNCYAEQVASRFSGPGMPYEGLITKTDKGPVWNGSIKLVPEKLEEPLRLTRPRRIFVNSMSDLFHENVPDEYIDRVFAVMALAHQHTFQVLTKRAERMKEYMQRVAGGRYIWAAVQGIKMPRGKHKPDTSWPLPNVWLGVSVENQEAADERIPLLLETPAVVRWISAEPLLGPINLNQIHRQEEDWTYCDDALTGFRANKCGGSNNNTRLDWVVVGGESGDKARPMHSDWVRSLLNQCNEARVAFLFKQWGNFISADQDECPIGGPNRDWMWADGNSWSPYDGQRRMPLFRRLGKKAAGRTLDGRTWDEYPEVA